MSLQPITPEEKNSMLLWIISPSLPIAIVGSITYGWVNIIWLLLIPVFPIIFLLGPDPRNPAPTKVMMWITMKIYQGSIMPLINFKFHKTKISDLIISSIPHHSKPKTWFLVCLVPLVLSITASNFMHLEITTQNGEPLTSNASAIVASLIFLPVFMFVGIAISMIDSSNLFVKSDRGETILSGNRLIQFLGLVYAIHIVFTVISTGKIDFFDNLYRFFVILAISHSCAIVYIFFLEKNMVSKFREYLVKDGIREANP